jgi:two-component system OmpR family sensor kinase
MARTAADVDAGDLSHRMSINGSPREVRVLAESFDHMLDRLEDAFARQRGFVADASHELRTPLTAIRGQLEVLGRQQHPSSEDVERVSRLVQTETERMGRLVEDLLLLARADEGHLVRPEEIDVEPFLLELFHALVPTADRHFELSHLPHGTIMADPDRTAQVIRNLARNAIAHTRPGGLVRIVATVRNGRLQIAVEDDGPGIPEAEWELVFDRFHRADRARARSGGGAGLGLAIAKALVEAHGGTIRVGRARAGGARVVFELPGFVAYA